MRILHACLGSPGDGRAADVAFGLAAAHAALLPRGRVLALGTAPRSRRADLVAAGFRPSAFALRDVPGLPRPMPETAGMDRAPRAAESDPAPSAPSHRASVAPHAFPELLAAGEVLVAGDVPLRRAVLLLPEGAPLPAAASLAADAALLLGPTLVGGRPDAVFAHGHGLGLLPLRARRAAAAATRRAFAAACVVHVVGPLASDHAVGKEAVEPLLLPWEDFRPEGFEWHDRLSLAKAGAAFADLVLFDGAGAADDARTVRGGAGLHGFFAALADRCVGVPMGLAAPPAPPADRAVARVALLARLRPAPSGRTGPPDDGGPALADPFVVVAPAPLGHAAGSDLLLFLGPRLVDAGALLLVADAGAPELRARLAALVALAPGGVVPIAPVDVPAALAAAHACLLPHRLADDGTLAWTAAALRTPLLLSAAGVHRDLLAHPDVVARAFPPDDAVAFVAAVRAARADGDLDTLAARAADRSTSPASVAPAVAPTPAPGVAAIDGSLRPAPAPFDPSLRPAAAATLRLLRRHRE